MATAINKVNRVCALRVGDMRVSKKKAAENRERILAEAARLFRERGLSGVGVDALTDAAGLTHGSLYSQFGSKERLAAEALSHALSTSFARVRPVRRPSGTSRRWLRDRGSGGPPSEDQDTLWAVRRARDRM